MEVFWKALALVLVSAILCLMLEQRGKSFSLLVTLAASVLLFTSAAKFLSPVMDFLSKLEQMGSLGSDTLKTLIKIFGMGMAGELSCAVCQDAGNSSLAKTLQFLTNAAIFYLSIPVFSSFMEIILELLKEV